MTIEAESIKLQAVILDPITGFRGHDGVDFGVDRFGQIEHPLAMLTGEMVVSDRVAVKTAKGAAEGEFDDFAGVPQELEVAVYRPEADVGDRLADLLVHPVSGGVGIRGPQDPENYLSLFGAAGGWRMRSHSITSFTVINAGPSAADRRRNGAKAVIIWINIRIRVIYTDMLPLFPAIATGL